jgi:hypothetical protein
MRCLNEPIARRANQEDEVTGRFWEGRFKCQALLDEHAMLAALTYVDLNPIRAKIAKDVASSKHTSVAKRVRQLRRKQVNATSALRPLAGVVSTLFPAIQVADYIDLADYTGRQWHRAQRGRISDHEPRALTTLGIDPIDWNLEVRGMKDGYARAVGAVDALLAKASSMHQRWLCGIGYARQLEH